MKLSSLSYGLLYATVWTGMRLLFRRRVHGLENVPHDGAALLIGNHRSYLDIPLVGTGVRRPVHFVARASLNSSRGLAMLIRITRSIPIEPRAPDRAALGTIVKELKAGELVAMFPEGTRAVEDEILPFRGGALLAARRAGVPLIPMGLRGTGQALPRGATWPRLRRLEVHFGEPIDPRSPEAFERARRQVAQLSGSSLAALPEASAKIGSGA